MFRRNAFGLSELLALLACIGILAGLLFPVLERSREKARQVTCLDNLVTIGRASLEYDEVNGFLPPYLTGPKDADLFDYQITYSQVQILNFLGASALADSVDPFAFEVSDSTLADAGYANLVDWLNGIPPRMPGIATLINGDNLPVARCPSDPIVNDTSAFGATTPSSSATVNGFVISGSDNFPLTNYAANGGGIGVTTCPTQEIVDQGFIGFHGPIRSQEADSVDSIPDGASNVAMFGEALGGVDLSSETRHAFIGGLVFGRGDLYPGVRQLFGTLEESAFFQFGSPHPNTVNFVRCDGSVTIVNRNADSQAIGRFCGAADGLKFELDLIGDVNLDNRVDLQDVSPFSDLIDSNQFQNEADIDQNGTVDLKDVQPFVNLISNQ